MPAGKVAAQEEMSAELVRKVAVVPLDEMRLCGNDMDTLDRDPLDDWVPIICNLYIHIMLSLLLLLLLLCNTFNRTMLPKVL